MPSKALNGPGYLESWSPFHASLQGLFPFPQPFGNERVCACRRGGKSGRKCPNQHKPMESPACVGAFSTAREEAGGRAQPGSPCPLSSAWGWGEAFLSPAGATARAGHGLCILRGKAPSCPCWSATRACPEQHKLCQQLRAGR